MFYFVVCLLDCEKRRTNSPKKQSYVSNSLIIYIQVLFPRKIDCMTSAIAFFPETAAINWAVIFAEQLHITGDGFHMIHCFYDRAHTIIFCFRRR